MSQPQSNAADIANYVQLAKNGDKNAFEQLVGELNNTVHAIALAITRDLQYSRDVSQLVFIKVWQQLNELKNNESVLPWVRQITRYTAINFIRDNKVRSEMACDDDTIEQLLSQLCQHEHSHDQALISQQQSDVINHLLDKLPDESREIIVLFYREDHDSNAVAKLLGLTQATVRKRLQRVRELLKTQVLAKYGQVIFATAPVGISTTIALLTMTTSPVAAATIATKMATTSQSHWLIKLLTLLGGSVIGAFFGVMANNYSINKSIKNVDNQQDIDTLQRIKRRGNIFIIASALALTASYELTNGWVMPVITYALFIIGLVTVIRTANAINERNLRRKAPHDKDAQRQLKRNQWTSKLGYVLGVGGGCAGLIAGLQLSGRFNTFF
jgi:RNA polymerase sigma factor (sigma-70 family)